MECVEEDEAQRIMIEMHKGECGGHHYWKYIAYKIFITRYYWPTLFSYVFSKVIACMECQVHLEKNKICFPYPLNPFQWMAHSNNGV